MKDEALITEREGMMAENAYRSNLGQGVAYTDYEFGKLAEKNRAKKVNEKPEAPSGKIPSSSGLMEPYCNPKDCKNFDSWN